MNGCKQNYYHAVRLRVVYSVKGESIERDNVLVGLYRHRYLKERKNEKQITGTVVWVDVYGSNYFL